MKLSDLSRRLPDEIWQTFEPILPPVVWCGNGRPPCGNRQVLHGLLYVLVTGIGWEMVPSCFPSGKTIQRRLKQWLELDCFGTYPYLCHGYLGREILVNMGLVEHALVCERHVGVGITADEVRHRQLPLPERNMIPVSIEEQIICFADKFFTKNGTKSKTEKPVKEILRKLANYGPDKVETFQSWVRMFS